MSDCPSQDQLQKLLDSNESKENQDVLMSHLQSCAPCRDTIVALSDDTNVAKWRILLGTSHSDVDDREKTELLEFLEELKRNAPPCHDQTSTVVLQKTLGNYDLLEKLGEGGMGMVYKARHRRMDRTVALKILPEEIAAHPGAVARFRQEIQASGMLSHPNIVTAFDADEVDGIPFIVTEFVEGSNLSQYVKQRGPLPIRDAISLILEAAHGLRHAHSRGLVHRDIKPSNLMVVRSATSATSAEPSRDLHAFTVKILDMGLASLQSTHPSAAGQPVGSLTETGAVMGTPAYMSPEQALETKSADARSDIYSLGCTLYFVLTGEASYEANTFTKTIVAHRELPIPRLRDVRSEVPAKLDIVFQKMLAKSPGDRYQSMGEVIDALIPFASSVTSADRTENSARRTRRVATALTAVSLVTAIGLIVWATQTGHQEGPTVDPSRFAAEETSGLDSIPGIILNPASIAGVDRWQVETITPRDKVVAPAWSPDGKLVAFGGADNQIRVYEADSLRLVQLLAGNLGEVRSLAWHPTRRLLASAAKDGTARVWDVESGRELHRFRHPRRFELTCVQWDPSGYSVAITGDGKSAYIWNPVDEHLTTLVGSGHAVDAVCWSPNGARLATGGRGGILRIWRVDGNLEFTSDALGHRIIAVDWDPQGEWITAGGAHERIQFWHHNGKLGPALNGPTGGTFTLEWSRDGERLAAGGMRGSKTVYIWNRARSPISVFNAGNHVESLSWSPDGAKLAVCDWDTRATIWTAAGEKLTQLGSTANVVTDLAWNHNGTLLAAATDRFAIRLWTQDGAQTSCLGSDSLRHTRAIGWIDNRSVVSAHLVPRGTLAFWVDESISRQITAFAKVDAQQIALDVRSTDGTLAVAMGSRIRLFPTHGDPIDLATGNARVGELSWNPRHNTLLTSNLDGSIVLWSEDGTPHKLLTAEPGTTPHIAWNANGAQFVVGQGYNLWYVQVDEAKASQAKASQAKASQIKQPYGRILSVSFNKQGSLASTHDDGKICLWDDQGAIRHTITGHNKGAGLKAAWHPTSSKLASAGRDAILRVWDSDSGGLVWSVALLADDRSVAFDSQGRILDGDFERINDQLVYTIENNGERQLLSPRQFHSRWKTSTTH